MMLAPRPTVLNLGPATNDEALATPPLDTPTPRFPHVRAALSVIAKRYKPTELDDDVNGDDTNRVSPTLVSRVVTLLEEEDEDQLQELLKETYSVHDDEEAAEQVLELMHAQRNDVSGVPFLFVSSPRRPISRPSSRASSHSVRFTGRPETPVSSSAPSSPLGIAFRRPHTPVVSPLGLSQSTSYMNAVSDSPSSSPTLAHAHATHAHAQFAASLPPSPLSSPRLLNAKAHEFKPIPRPLARAASFTSSLSALRAQTPSPDLWAHKASSNLAIAAPLLPESASMSRVPTPSSSLRASVGPSEDDDDHDPFDPFSTKAPPPPLSFPTLDSLDFDSVQWSNESNSNSSLSAEEDRLRSTDLHDSPTEQPAQANEAEEAVMLTDGMTPFDVLSSVFGTTLAPSELEEALAANAYDFDRAMAWLIERSLPSPPAKGLTSQQYMGGRVTVVSRGGRGVANGTGRASPRFMNGRSAPGGNRVCRYFLAGECLRADCRFSHDLERALCRFWLRGTCAKGESCEFLHHLPDVDISQLSAAMSSTSLDGHVGRPSTPPVDEFPVLGSDGSKAGGFGHERSAHLDPSRTRFAAAVKKSVPSITKPTDSATLLARRQAMGPSADSLHHHTAIIAPRPSPRIKLRPPFLLPTLPTGGAVNDMYMSYRSRALQLGAARNACLSRAADAWRRGDGAAAKRFSREGHDLNAKMRGEMAESARKLVRERNKIVEQTVRARDASWSDDPADRTTRGKTCGAGLGVFLGVVSREAAMEIGRLTPEERTECILDLHGLHANEATEVLEEFLVALEKEHFYGLAYLLVGEEKHTGTQDPARGASRVRLATAVRETLHHWGYPWSERRDGIICVDALTHE